MAPALPGEDAPADEAGETRDAVGVGGRPSRPVHPALLAVAAFSVVVLAALAVAAFAWPRGGGDGPPEAGDGVVGAPLPALEFEDFDGRPQTLDGGRGPLVINFFAYWCTPCREEMPDFQRVYERYGDQVSFLGLDYIDQIDNGLRIIEETGITYEVGRDPTGTVLEGLGGMAMPTTVFVDADGTVTSVHSGQLDEAALERALVDELGVRPEPPR